MFFSKIEFRVGSMSITASDGLQVFTSFFLPSTEQLLHRKDESREIDNCPAFTVIDRDPTQNAI